MAEISEEERRSLAGRVQMRRREKFGTKSEAYRAAGVNAATWDRIEAGLSVRDDRLTAALKALWPESGGDWTAIGREEPMGSPVLDGNHDDPDYLSKIEAWLLEITSRVEALEAEVARQRSADDWQGLDLAADHQPESGGHRQDDEGE